MSAVCTRKHPPTCGRCPALGLNSQAVPAITAPVRNDKSPISDSKMWVTSSPAERTYQTQSFPAERRSNAAIPVAWTFMSEMFAMHRRIVERRSRHNNFRFDAVVWPCDGHGCPSYRRSYRHHSLSMTFLRRELRPSQTFHPLMDCRKRCVRRTTMTSWKLIPR